MPNTDLRHLLPPSTRRASADDGPTEVVAPPFDDDADTQPPLSPPDFDTTVLVASCPSPSPRQPRPSPQPQTNGCSPARPPPPPALVPSTPTPSAISTGAPTPGSLGPAAAAPHIPGPPGPGSIHLPDRPAAWASEQKTRRPFPRGVRIAAVGGGGLLLLVVVAGRCQSDAQPTAITTYDIGADQVVNGEDLRNRKELTAEDFRADDARIRIREPPSHASSASSPTTASPAPEPPTEPALSLEERRARRLDNPDDLIQHRRPRASTPSRADPDPELVAKTNDRSAQHQDLIFFVRDQSTSHAPGTDAQSGARRLLPAATRLPARLVSNLELRGNSATALVRLDRPSGLPVGTTIIGQARADREGRVDIRFHSAILPSGEKLRVQAEAQGTDGTTGLFGQVAPTQDQSDDGSIAGDVAESTSSRLVASALGTGLAGAAASDALASRNRRARRPTYGQSTDVVTIPKGTAVWLLFLDEVTTDD